MTPTRSRINRLLSLELVRFVLGGGSNTLISFACYLVLLRWVDYPVAYTLSFALGVLSGYAINTYLVFRATWSWAKLSAFPLVQLANYLAGLLVIWAAVRWLHIDEHFAPLLAIAATIPLNFLLTRALIKGPR